jgi:hypothetical protein
MDRVAIAGDAPFPRHEMKPVAPTQSLECKLPEPLKKGDTMIPEILRQPPSSIRQRLLHDVGGVDTRQKSPVDTGCDHPAQAAAMPLEKPSDRPLVAGAGTAQQFLRLGTVLAHHRDGSSRVRR